MNDETIVGKKVFPNWHRIKVYTVVIEDSLNSTIWYASKKGKSFHAVLQPKATAAGWVAMFRVIELSEDFTSIKDPVLIRHINPCDCTVSEEKQLRIIDRMERLTIGAR